MPVHVVEEIVRIERRGLSAALAFDQSLAQPRDVQFLFLKQPQAGGVTEPSDERRMIGFGIFALVWPFLSIGLAVACVLAFHRYLDRREQRRHHAAE